MLSTFDIEAAKLADLFPLGAPGVLVTADLLVLETKGRR